MLSAVSSQGKVRFMIYQDTMNQQRHGAPNSRFKTEGVPDSGQKDKIEVFFLPPHAPEYNPDEYLNHALKISVHSGQLPYTREDLCHKF